MSLDNLPPEVISDHILPHLKVNELLGLGRVSRSLRVTTKETLKQAVGKKVHFIGHNDRVVGLDEKEGWRRIEYVSMKDFLSMDLPLPPRRFNFDFRTQDPLFTDEPWMLPRFLGVFGNWLTHLTLSELTLPLNGKKDTNFFKTISASLCYLSIDILNFNEPKNEDEVRAIPPFQNLKNLRINHLEPNEDYDIEDLQYFWSIVEACVKLQYFYMPSIPSFMLGMSPINQDHLDLRYQKLGYLLEAGLLKQLKVYNMKSVMWMDADAAGTGTFIRFCDTIKKHSIKLEFVNCRCFDGVQNQQQLQTIGSLIYSMSEFTLTRGGMEFPFLEKLCLETMLCHAGNPDDNFIVPQWPALKSLSLCIDSHHLEDYESTGKLFRLLFKKVQRPSIECLELYGSRDMFGNAFMFPDLKQVAWSCANLTSLTIQDWLTLESEYSCLWKGLPKLQSLTLIDCLAMTIGSFTGGNEDEPVFLKLKNLKTLRLIQVHNMEFITDHLFKIVFARLRVREFILDSYIGGRATDQLEIITFTQAGILNLLFSEFANTIEVFPFTTWRLRGFTRQAMMELGKLFRSAYMV